LTLTRCPCGQKATIPIGGCRPPAVANMNPPGAPGTSGGPRILACAASPRKRFWPVPCPARRQPLRSRR
jgi:hypothetical protein